MPLVINTNVSSLNSQRQLVRSGMELDQAMERLSSGKRVNNAADDAAGLAIANRMTSQVMGLNQSIRNANDGVSMIQTAEGAMDETTNMLQRMRELAIQAANGIYSDADRSTLDAEVQQLKLELNRIAESTTFNGQPLLDGSQKDVTLQVGSEAGDTIAYSISALDTSSLGGESSSDVVGTTSTGLQAALAVIDGTANTLSINGQDVGDLSTAGNLGEALDIINQNVSGVDVNAFVETTGTTDGTGIIRGGDFVSFEVDLQDGSTNTIQITDTGSIDEVAEAINTQGGGTLKASINDDGRLVLESNLAATITVDEDGTTALAAIGIAAGDFEATLAFEITESSIESVDVAYGGTANGGTGPSGVEIQAIGVQARNSGDITGAGIAAAADSSTTSFGTGDITINDVAITGFDHVADADSDEAETAASTVSAINAQTEEHGIIASANATTGAITLNSVDGSEIKIELSGQANFATTGLIETNNASSRGDSIENISIDTVEGAQSALNVIDVSLETINAIRADLGAVNNRLEFTMSNLANVVENTEAARSRIMDADFAAESAALSRAQVLQQASQAMLAQANARPQQVLQLLQG